MSGVLSVACLGGTQKLADIICEHPLTENYIFSVVSVGGHLDVGDCGFWPFPAVSKTDGLGWLVVVDHSTRFLSDPGIPGVRSMGRRCL